MRHLSEETLLDLAEGTRAEYKEPHLALCEACRAKIADLRAMMSVADVDVPEPSPLYWDHFSSRVRAAIAEELPPAAVWGWSWRLVVPVAALAVIVLAAVLNLRPWSGDAPAQSSAGQLASDLASDAQGAAAVINDPSLTMMTDLAGDLEFDAVIEAGLTTSAVAVDGVLADMSADERRERQRILKQEMSRQGA